MRDVTGRMRVSVGAATALLLAAAIWAQMMLNGARPVTAPMLAEGALAAFGAIRSLAAEVVWFRADRLQDEGRYVELAQLAHALTAAEPHTPEVWSYAAWNLAYNVSVMMPTGEDRWRWVLAAVKLLRDDGLRLNPTSAELHRELAWLFELKMGTEIDAAAETFRRKWREIADDAAARGAWQELGMEPELMAEVERRFGVRDRSDPLYSAIYWAYRGCRHATGHELGSLKDIIRQSKMIYEKERKKK